jgi:hypothetical protein
VDAATASRAATAHIQIPGAGRRVAACWTAWRAIGARPFTALRAAVRALSH